MRKISLHPRGVSVMIRKTELLKDAGRKTSL